MDTRGGAAEHLTSRVRFAPGVRVMRGARTAMAPQLRKSTQRARLLDGMVHATVERGYRGANVSAVIGLARVSRPTFYDYFADREACLLATIEDVQERLLERTAAALAESEPAEALGALVRTLARFAEDEPLAARFLMAEALAGGAPALGLRDRGIDSLAELVRAREAHARPSTALADIDPRVVAGSAYRMLAIRLRRGEAQLSRLAHELAAWVAAFERPARSRRWATLSPGRQAPASPHIPSGPIQEAPNVFPPGRPRVSEEEIAENHRLRILYAVARLAGEKGYAATTVGEITKLARIDGRAFYRLFADKQEAFLAVHELGFQQVMDVTARAFFAGRSWPERAWEAGRALTQLLDANPLVAHVGFVEAYAVGAGAVQRIEDSHTAFMFFLQEGLLDTKREPPPSREVMEAIVAAAFEIIYREARRAKPQTALMLDYIAHLWLTPFLGVRPAERFIERQGKPARAGARGG